MDTQALHEIIGRTCQMARHGEVFEGSPNLVEAAESGDPDAMAEAGGGVLEVNLMPHVDDPAFEGYEMVNCFFTTIAVDKEAAEAERENLVAILNDWPYPDRLAGGPSYIEVGAVIGDQGAAFALFALGKVLGLWDILTPETLGVHGNLAHDLAGRGFIMCSGYMPEDTA